MRDKIIAENQVLKSRIENQTEQITMLKSHIGLIRQHTITFILDQMDTLHMQRDTEVWPTTKRHSGIPLKYAQQQWDQSWGCYDHIYIQSGSICSCHYSLLHPHSCISIATHVTMVICSALWEVVVHDETQRRCFNTHASDDLAGAPAYVTLKETFNLPRWSRMLRKW